VQEQLARAEAQAAAAHEKAYEKEDLIRELDARRESEAAANSQLATLKAELQQAKAEAAAAQEKVRLVESTPVARALLANEQSRAREVGTKFVGALSPTHAKVSPPASISTTASSPALVNRTTLARRSYGAASPRTEVRAGGIAQHTAAPGISKGAPGAASRAAAGVGSPGLAEEAVMGG